MTVTISSLRQLLLQWQMDKTEELVLPRAFRCSSPVNFGMRRPAVPW